MRTTLSAITNGVPIPPTAPLPTGSLERAKHLEREAWDSNRELDALMHRLEVLSDIAMGSGCYDSPAQQFWNRCHRISQRAARRWRRRQALFLALKNEHKEP